jgi:hypothetical protein
MPQLSDLVEKRKFIKKEYRPWDLSGTGTVDGKEIINQSIGPEATTAIAPQLPVIPEKNVPIKGWPSIDATTIQATEISDNKTGNNQVTTKKQPGNIKITTKKQPDNIKVTTREHTNNVLDNNTGNIEELAYLIESIKKLSGIQKNIFFYIINICSARGVLDTGNVLSSDLANTANCTVGSAKTSLIRLIEKRLILRLQGKASRGGHMLLGITKEIQAASIQAQQILFNPLKMIKTDNITGNITNNILAYSSSIYKNTTTSLPEEWKKINFELLGPIGFSETQLCQLHDSNMTSPEIVQDAINRFAYSLQHSDKVKAYTDPLNVLMGVLRKGQRWNEPNYVTPKEIALRQMLEEKRNQKEQFDAMVKELIELEFPDWKRKLTEEQIKQMVPADTLKTNLTPAIHSALRVYFTENILLPRLETK